MLVAPRAQRDYPADLGEFGAWFSKDADCLDYLRWLRWPGGFACENCGAAGWLNGDGRYECSSCHLRTSVTAGTIFDRTRTPLTVWFHAAWLFATSKDGISAMALQRQLGLRSHQTAWTMLTKLRTVTVNPGRDLLTGDVEVDETFYGGRTPGQRGGRQHGAKLPVIVAVERHQPRGFGRCRMGIVDRVNHATLRQFLVANVAPGATIHSDGLNSYVRATGGLYNLNARPAPGAQAPVVLPGAHRVASLFKRWMLGIHQGSADWDHLALYLDEFVFRLNRRTSRHRGLVFLRLMEQAVAHGPAPYRELIVTPRPKSVQPTPPSPMVRGRTLSLERTPERRPWRS